MEEPMHNSAITAAFDTGPAFVPYLTAGDPTFEASLEYVQALERGGASVIELGLPFSEPIAEGKTIQNAISRSLEGGMTPVRFFKFLEQLDVTVPLVCMTYYNLIYQYGTHDGPRPFVERAATAGLDGIIVPDLPAEEAGPLHSACQSHGLDLITIVAPTTTTDRLERLVSLCSGYLYVQARLGVTGARSDVSEQTAASLDRLTDIELPVAVGFGISSGEHARTVIESGADGVIVGSALVEIIGEGHRAGDSPDMVAQRLEAKSREITTAITKLQQQP